MMPFGSMATLLEVGVRGLRHRWQCTWYRPGLVHVPLRTLHTLHTLLPQAVATAPVAIYYEVTRDFQHYSGGVYSNAECSGETNHARALAHLGGVGVKRGARGGKGAREGGKALGCWMGC